MSTVMPACCGLCHYVGTSTCRNPPCPACFDRGDEHDPRCRNRDAQQDLQHAHPHVQGRG
eukprot:1059786-Prymnesium_polylepis.1